MKCFKCNKKEVVVELRYSKQSLCRRCFIRLFEKRVRKTIRKNKLFYPTDKVAVALSGGKDSMTALHMLNELSKKAPRSELLAITIDEGIKDRKDAHHIAKSFCEKLGVQHHIFSFKDDLGRGMDEIAKEIIESGISGLPCSYCGVLRRDLLNRKARKLGVTKLVTGHNLDDEVQTALMNFIRGDLERIARSGSEIGVIKDDRFVPRIKPLRECPEDEVKQYAELNDLKPELSVCPYSKYAFRNTIRNAVNEIEAKHPGSKFQILATLDTLIPILKNAYKSRFSGSSPNNCKICGELSSGEICKSCELKKSLGIE